MDPELWKDPMPLVAAVVGMLSASEESPMMTDADREEISGAIRFFAERIMTLTRLVDSSAPSVNFFESLPRGEGGRRRGPARTVLFDVARGLARRVPLTKLVSMDSDVRPFLASLMVAALQKANEKLLIPDDLEIVRMSKDAWEAMLAKQAGQSYDNYGTISQDLLGP
jgi:hypothetical protein